MATLVVHRHPVTTLVTNFTSPSDLTKDPSIFKLYVLNEIMPYIRYATIIVDAISIYVLMGLDLEICEVTINKLLN